MKAVGKNQLTEAKLANRRFCETERRILKTFFEDDNYVSIGEMARKAGVARSTFYRHHSRIGRIVEDYEEFAMESWHIELARDLRKGRKRQVKQIYLKMLTAIVKNEKAFLVILRSGRRRIFAKMIEEVRLEIEKETKMPEGADKMFKVYVAEVAEILAEWGERGFLREETEVVLEDMMALTEGMPKRLGILLEKA